MKLKPLFAAVPVTFALLTGCTWDSMTPHSVFPMKMERAGAQFDGEIIKDLMVIDKAEMASSKLAMHKAQHAKLREFAKFLHTAHAKCLRHLEHFSHKHHVTPVTSLTATSIESRSQLELARLEHLSGSAFDKAYIEDVIHCHKSAIGLLDNAIAKSKDANLTHLLKETRHHIEKHLHRAEVIQKELMRK